VLAGTNGQGKTNLVEAVFYLSTLGSHRVTGDAALIRAGEDSAVIRATVVAGGRETLAEVLINRAAPNRAQLNRKPVRPREITRSVSSVLFAPEDLAIVRGEPSARRRFLDELLVARSPRLAGVLSDYDKALRQRNGLLKASRGRFGMDAASLDAWDERLVSSGAEWLDARDVLVTDLTPLVAEQYRLVAGADQAVAMRTVRGIDPEDGRADEGADAAATAERFLTALHAARPRELERGVTLVGPHRDDLLLTVNDLPARGYASHGESWSLALALRLGAVELLRGTLPTGDPIVILDDVFAELDEARRNRLAARVGRYEQVLITAAVEGDIPEPLHRHVTRIKAGTVLS
jgi:DNA replication and repair protein RecF